VELFQLIDSLVTTAKSSSGGTPNSDDRLTLLSIIDSSVVHINDIRRVITCSIHTYTHSHTHGELIMNDMHMMNRYQ
jgi:hypothetical protein